MLVSAALSVTTWGEGRVDVFAIGTGGTLYHKGGVDGGWYGDPWDNLSNPRLPLTAAAAASWGPGRVDVFAVGTDASTYHKWGTPPTAWQQPTFDNLGGTLVSAPCAVSASAGALDCFGIGADGGVWHIAWNAQTQWSAWTASTPQSNLGRPGLVSFTGAVSAIATAGGLAVFALGDNDGNIYVQTGTSAAWPGKWTLLAPPASQSFTSNPVAVSRGGANVDVVCVATDGQMYHNASASGVAGFGAWKPLGGQIVSDPCLVSATATSLDAFGVGTDGAIWRNTWNGTNWGGWAESLGTPPGVTFVSAPSAVSAAAASLDVFGLASDGRVYHRGWRNGAWAAGWDSLGGPIFVEQPPQNIGLQVEYQQTPVWCWVAVGASIVNFYNPGLAATQAGLVTYFGPQDNQFPPGTTCFPSAQAKAANPLVAEAMIDPFAPTALYVLNQPLSNPAQSICIHSGGVGTVFDTYGASAGTQSNITMGEIQAQLAQGRPIAVGLTWLSGGAHTVAIVGAVDNLILISDPAAGESVIPLSDFPAYYNGGAKWPDYYFTQPPTKQVALPTS